MKQNSTCDELERRVQELEKELHDARFLTEEIMTYMTEGLVLTDMQGTVTFINQRLLEMLGYLPGQIIGKSWLEMVPPGQLAIARAAEARRAQGHTDRYEIVLRRKNGHEFPVMIGAGPRFDKHSGEFIGTMGVVTDISERRQAEDELRKYEWLIEKEIPPADTDAPAFETVYGDITALNTRRLILEGVGKENLKEMAADVMALLDTSLAVYEANGDYAYGVFKSSWCQFMDTASFHLCGTKDVGKALSCGKWLCHDNCWNDSAQTAMVSGKPSDIECVGGIRLYAVPIFAEKKVIGSVNIGYGNPPQDDDTLARLAEKYHIDLDQLRAKANAYKPRPEFIIELGKRRCQHMARMIGKIIERRQAEKSRQKYQKDLEKRNHFIQTILDNLPIGLAVNSIDEGQAIYINKQFEQIYGWPREQIKDIDTFFYKAYPDPAYREKIMTRVFEDTASGDPEKMAWDGVEITRQDGEKRVVSAKNIPLQEQNLMISTVQDITENTKLQNQLLQARKMESVGRLAGGVAHDFNNMLGVILGHVEFALEKIGENHDLAAGLKEIQTAARRSADLTKQLLTFARKQIISPRPLDLNDTVESMLNMLRRLIGEDIDLVWKPAAHSWTVKMDPSQIDQILANLCINARDAIAGVGRLTIETGKKTFDEQYCRENAGFIPGDYALLSVSDNGCGMDRDTLKNLFEPFFTTKEMGKGTGLGLATIYGIVKQNSGFINVYSEPGQGSTFNIYLPRFAAEGREPGDIPREKTAAAGTETILVVEDEPAILRMTCMMLEQKGYTVLPAATPAEALEKVENHSCAIDLLLSDVVLPEMSGRDLAGQIMGLCPGIRILFMSGYTADVIAHQGVLDDGVAFIQKPFSMNDLLGKVRHALDHDPGHG
ncbi:PAS domain S-box protein [Desulfotignum balticum]|jgi:PAS domain S-box-containing protein|uniref:PAS domain S-box protein n=1 Tax=Desulfotignum balticum TaxID=115781 RepID=UPI0004265D50|nr:PAS domain S-box protein [Desulfotignum balticum]